MDFGVRLRSLCASVSVFALLMLVLAGCSTGKPTLTAPGISYPAGSLTAVVGTAISPITPSITGSASSFTVAPALPAGLSLGQSTGVISGTPTTAAASASYIVTASNGGGSSSATIVISVIVAPSGLVYPQTSISAVVGRAIAPDTPTVVGTSPTFTISPALPAGLSLNATTGTISGTPTAASSQASYTVTASNGGGSVTATLSISAVLAPSALVYPQTTITGFVGQAIVADTPTLTGSSPVFTVSPALPAGLAINSTTGSISGTPTALTAQASYTVTATNIAGSTAATITISVGPAQTAPSGFAYPISPITAMIGDLLPSDAPSVSGTSLTFSVQPALPPGLTLNPSNGIIYGSPTTASAKATYTVTASNGVGTATAALSITVSPLVPLLKTGLGGQVTFIKPTTSRVLSQSGSYWALNDSVSGNLLAEAHGFGAFPVDLAGSTIAIGSANAVDIRSATDAHLITTITSSMIDTGSGTWWTLATDGRYLAAGSSQGLSIWSTADGQMLFTKTGDYSLAKTYAAPTQLQIAGGATGTNIETIKIGPFTSTTSSTFSGGFQKWFSDGTHFLTNLGTTLWVYSAAGVQENILSVSSFSQCGGFGSFFYTYYYNGSSNGGYILSVYNLSSTTPTATFPLGSASSSVIQSGSTLGVFLPSRSLSLVDLSGSTPVLTSFTSPVGSLSAFGAVSASQWELGNGYGVVFDTPSNPRYLTLGAAWGMAGGSSYAAVATASGSIYVFSPPSATPVAIIPFAAQTLSMSTDGRVLAASGDTTSTDRTVNIYSIPAATSIATYPSNYNAPPWIWHTALSGSGTVLAEVYYNLTADLSRSFSSCSVGPVTGESTTWFQSFQSDCNVALSPDGTSLSVSLPNGSVNTTQIVQSGALKAAISGLAAGWIDNGHLLVNNYRFTLIPVFVSASVYDSSGVLLGPSGLNNVTNFQALDSNSVYVPTVNQIQSVGTGLPSWTGLFSSNRVGAVSGRYVVYATGARVVAEPY